MSLDKFPYVPGEIIGKGPAAMRQRAAAAKLVDPHDLERARYDALRKDTEQAVQTFLFEFWKALERCDSRAKRRDVLRGAARKKFIEVPNFVLEELRSQFDRTKEGAIETKIIPCALCSKPSRHRHHVIQLRFGGPNHISNLIAVCDSCHIKVHG
jgi:hypothetical protein